MSKTIYHYQPVTGEYLGEGQALRDPVEPEHYLMPADTTDQPPPEPGERQAAVFNPEGQEWSLVDDWRGHEYWTEDGQQHRIAALDQAPPDDALDEPPPPAPEDLAVKARGRRNALLRSSDWTQLGDAQQRLGEQLTAEWTAYRQALADLPQQPGFPDSIEWPQKPVSP